MSLHKNLISIREVNYESLRNKVKLRILKILLSFVDEHQKFIALNN